MTLAHGPYTCLYREIWTDDKFWKLSPMGQRLYLYILSSPMGNGLGCFRAGIAAMADDLQTIPKRFLEWFAEGFSERLPEPLYMYDEHHKVLYIPKYFIRNPPNNPNGIKALAKEFVKIPDCHLKGLCYQSVKSFVECKGESFAQSFRESFKEPLLEQPGTISPSLSPSLSSSPTPSIAPTPTSTRSRGNVIDSDDGFDSFWKTYPRKTGKKEARKAWDKAKDRPSIDIILAAIEAQKRSPQWTKDDGQFIPLPATWLNQGRWDDEAPEDNSTDLSWLRPKRDTDGIKTDGGEDCGSVLGDVEEPSPDAWPD